MTIAIALRRAYTCPAMPGEVVETRQFATAKEATRWLASVYNRFDDNHVAVSDAFGHARLEFAEGNPAGYERETFDSWNDALSYLSACNFPDMTVQVDDVQ